MQFQHLVAATFCIAMSGCIKIPVVAEADVSPGPPPALLPLDGLLPDDAARDDPAPALAARSASLKARAAAIGTP